MPSSRLCLSLCYAVRTVRPLARRALMIARPLLVAIRARNPCVRLRLIWLGWKVRFMLINLGLN